jgi:hypothetical protein
VISASLPLLLLLPAPAAAASPSQLVPIIMPRTIKAVEVSCEGKHISRRVDEGVDARIIFVADRDSGD